MTQKQVVHDDIDAVLADAASYTAMLILKMKPGETLTITRGEDGPNAIRIKGGRV